MVSYCFPLARVLLSDFFIHASVSYRSSWARYPARASSEVGFLTHCALVGTPILTFFKSENQRRQVTFLRSHSWLAWGMLSLSDGLGLSFSITTPHFPKAAAAAAAAAARVPRTVEAHEPGGRRESGSGSRGTEHDRAPGFTISKC